MSASTRSANANPGRGAIGTAALATLAGIAALIALFWGEANSAVQVWLASTAYGHCFFIVPIALFLAWERRAVARATPVVPMPALALLAIPLSLIWLAANRLGIMEGQQILAMALLELMFAAVLGWRMFRALAVPMLYLGFLVPFGAFITPALQAYTAWFITHGLDVLGVANLTDGNLIQIPEGNFFVAEACAGLRFLIASIAFGVLYACMIYRSWPRRAAFIAAALVIPIIANGFRGLGIVWLGHVMGSAQAVAVDHVVYGWIFFSMVIVLLILVGLPFREDGGPLPVPDYGNRFAAPKPGRVWGTLALVLALSAVAPAAAALLDRRGDQVAADLPAPGAFALCRVDAGTARGTARGTTGGTAEAGVVTQGRLDWGYSCADNTLRLRVSLFSPRVNPGAIGKLLRSMTDELSAEDVAYSTLGRSGNAEWLLATTTGPDRLLAFAEWIDGKPATGGLAQRLALGWGSLAGTDAAPLLVSLRQSAPGEQLNPAQRRRIKASMAAVLAANPDMAERLLAISRAGGRSAAPAR